MFEQRGFSSSISRLADRIVVRSSLRKARRTSGFVSEPEPRSIGNVSRGEQLLEGHFRFAGHLVEAPDASIWSLKSPSNRFDLELFGFGWLDDLAAVGDGAACALGQRWFHEWLATYGRGKGAGWAPQIAGRRVLRLIHHSAFLQHGMSAHNKQLFLQTLAHHASFLAVRAHKAPAGLPRFEALTGLICASTLLVGFDDFIDAASRRLAHECRTQIDQNGAIQSRNPEELLEIFRLLNWNASNIADAGRGLSKEHRTAIERSAPTLRTLRHVDGGLARFHGGGRGGDGQLDLALAQARVRAAPLPHFAMGFARLSAGRTSVIIDAAEPLCGLRSVSAHASTLAFELTTGRRPLIVNCGSGVSFGREWRRAGRATPSHSTLCLRGYSSARLGSADTKTDQESLVSGPRYVPTEYVCGADGTRFQGGHDGFVNSHGLTHARTLEMSMDGRSLVGEDMLLAMTDPEKQSFDKALVSEEGGVLFDIHFHLHPNAAVTFGEVSGVLRLGLPSGEVWEFRHDETLALHIQPSVYLEKEGLEPRATRQIVLSGQAETYATRIRWSLSKTQETAIGVRDFAPDMPPSAQ